MTEPSLLNKRILVVEDNTVNQLLVKYTLGKTGAQLHFAGDGGEALGMLREQLFDLVLMDLQLPVMDGFETSYFIRNEMQSMVPIVAMSAMMMPGEKEKCLQAGMNGYITKPFTLSSLLEGIEQSYIHAGEGFNAENMIGDHEVSIDLSVLNSLGVDDVSYQKAVVDTFLSNMPGTIQQLERLCENKDYEGLMKMAHYAKSSLSIVRVNQLFETVQNIEWSCKNSSALELIPLKVEYIKARYPKAESILRKRFYQSPQVPDAQLLKDPA